MLSSWSNSGEPRKPLDEELWVFVIVVTKRLGELGVLYGGERGDVLDLAVL